MPSEKNPTVVMDTTSVSSTPVLSAIAGFNRAPTRYFGLPGGRTCQLVKTTTSDYTTRKTLVDLIIAAVLLRQRMQDLTIEMTKMRV